MQTKMATARRSAEMLAFEHWLRTGSVLHEADLAQRMERKFNPYHDPQDGRFT